jgi:hypothetical protein
MLSTIAVEVASVYLRKLHHIGIKLTNVGAIKIWFGGTRYVPFLCPRVHEWACLICVFVCRVEVRELLIEVCKSLDIPIDRLNNLNLDRIVTRRLIDHAEPDPHDSDYLEVNYSLRLWNNISLKRAKSCSENKLKSLHEPTF